MAWFEYNPFLYGLFVLLFKKKHPGKVTFLRPISPQEHLDDTDLQSQTLDFQLWTEDFGIDDVVLIFLPFCLSDKMWRFVVSIHPSEMKNYLEYPEDSEEYHRYENSELDNVLTANVTFDFSRKMSTKQCHSFSTQMNNWLDCQCFKKHRSDHKLHLKLMKSYLENGKFFFP